MLDKQDLKIRALLEKLSSIVANYENQLADLRVEYTVKDAECNEALARIEELTYETFEALEEPYETVQKK